MDAKLAEQILEELVPTLEALDTQSTAITRFLKDKGIATDAEFAPYLEQAASTSNVRWRAIGLRMKRLFALAEKEAEKKSEEQSKANAAQEKNSAKAQAEKPKTDPTNGAKEGRRQDAEVKLSESSPRLNQAAELTKTADEDSEQGTSSEPNRQDAAQPKLSLPSTRLRIPG